MQAGKREGTGTHLLADAREGREDRRDARPVLQEFPLITLSDPFEPPRGVRQRDLVELRQYLDLHLLTVTRVSERSTREAGAASSSQNTTCHLTFD